VQLSRNLGTLTSWNPLGPSGPVTGLLYLYLLHLWYKFCLHQMMHELRGNVWRHKSRDYNIKNHSNVNAKFKMYIYNKNWRIFLHNFAHTVKFLLVFGRCSVRISDRLQTAATETLRLATQFRQITLNETPTISFKNQVVGLFRNFRIHYVCCFNLQKR